MSYIRNVVARWNARLKGLRLLLLGALLSLPDAIGLLADTLGSVDLSVVDWASILPEPWATYVGLAGPYFTALRVLILVVALFQKRATKA